MKKVKLVSMVLLIQLLTPFFSILEIEVIPSTAKQQGVTLYGITRHDGVIRTKFTNAFKAKFPEVDDILWLERTVFRQWIGPIIGSDPISILWGGGTSIFEPLVEEGLITPFNDTELVDYIEANISAHIAGSDMIRYDDSDNILWVASSLTSFGFTVNHDNLALYNISIPETWEDLASPEYYLGSSEHAIGIGDAPETTSNTRIYQIILQKYGWEKGWEILTRMAGNAKIFEGGSGPTRDSVISGDQAIALTIDFYGYRAQTLNSSCEYIIPENCSIIEADPIAVASSAPNMTIAQEFVKFVLSTEGQVLWLDLDTNRLPILYDTFDYARDFNGNDREDMRENYLKTINITGTLFNESLAQSIYDIVTFYFQGALTHSIDQLYSAWERLVIAYRDHGRLTNEEFHSLSQGLSVPKISLQEGIFLQDQYEANPNMRDSLVTEYATYSKSNYNKIKSWTLNMMTISIFSPSNGSFISGNVLINAAVRTYNEYNVSLVNFSLHNSSTNIFPFFNITSNFENIQFIWDTTEVDDGVYSLNMTVMDTEGIMHFRTISIIINNTLETIQNSFSTSNSHTDLSNEKTIVYSVIFFLLITFIVLVFKQTKTD